MVQFYKEISKFGYFKNMEKSQNKVAVAEEIGCRNDIALSKIGKGNELRQKNKNKSCLTFLG